MGEFVPALFPFMCVFLRTTGIFVTAPVLAAKYIPASVKVGLSLATSFFLAGLALSTPVPETFAGMAAAFAGEIAFGLFVGFIAAMIMASVEIAGHLADIELGFGLSNVIDPEHGASSPLMGIFKYLLITLIFMMLDGHHLFIRALAESFRIIPAGSATVSALWAAVSVETAAKMLRVGLELSCPVWAAMLVTDIALGVVARNVPQMNIFVVGMPVKAIAGLMVLSASLGFYGVFTQEITITLRNILESLLGAFAR